MELNDAALIRACQQGDAAAWDTLVARYERLIFTIARRSGLDADEAAAWLSASTRSIALPLSALG